MTGVVVLMVFAAGALTADQATKALVTRQLLDGRAGAVTGGRRVRLVRNGRGGLLGLSVRRAGIVLVLSAAYSSVIVLFGSPMARPAVEAGLGLILGGSAGNLTDRARLGAVTDFIALGRWPAFNLADCAIVAGALLVAWSVA